MNITKNQRTITIRMNCDILDAIENQHRGTRQGAFQWMAQRDIVGGKFADMEIRGRFTPAEWKYLADIFIAKVEIPIEQRYSVTQMVEQIHSIELKTHKAKKWEVDAASIMSRIENLSAAQVEAIYRRIEIFWIHAEKMDLEVWAAW